MNISLDTDGAPIAVLGGKPWPVPLLAAKQNKIIDPLILSLLPVFALWQNDKSGALAQIGATQYEALQEIAYTAIRRAHPELTRDQFMDMPVTLPELIAAFSIIAQQTGVFARGKGETEPGEAPGAASPPNSLTGTVSSPISAT